MKQSTIRHIGKYYNALAETYDVHPGACDYGSEISQKLKFEKVISVLPNTFDSILDFGCGSGILGIAVNKLYGVKGDLYDIDQDAINNCIQNIELNIVYNRTHDEFGNRLPFPVNNTQNREEPIGYNLFRDNSFIDFTEDTWYLDTDISSGTVYCYDLTAVYEEYQSLHTNDVCIETEGLPVDPGDLNIDGSLDVLDIVILVNMILGVEDPNYAIGDMDQDGVLTVLDVILLINSILDN